VTYQQHGGQADPSSETVVLPTVPPTAAAPADPAPGTEAATGEYRADAYQTGAATAGPDAGRETGQDAGGGRMSSLLRSSSVMALGTVMSRITGFVRNLVIAAAIGTQVLGDTYTVANTIPTIIYILLIGGALNSVFVPQLVRAMKNDEDGGEAYASRLITATATILLGVTVAAVLAAPLLVDLYTTNLSDAELGLSTAFARYCLPTIFFFGLYVMLGQVLNARDRFGAMMFTPILNNVVVIATFGTFLVLTDVNELTPANLTPAEIRLLGLGTALGVMLQALALVPYVRAAGIRLRPRFDWRGVGLGKAAQLAKWTVLLVAVNQLGYVVVVNVATGANKLADQAGLDLGVGYAAYSNAYLLLMLPHSIVTVSVVTALLPRMSRAASEDRLDVVRDDLSSSLRLIGVATVPAAFAFLALGRDMGGMLYSSIGSGNAHVIGYVLTAFGLALIPFSAQYMLVRGFYAFEDTRTPVLIAVVTNAVNVVLVLTAYAVLPVRWVVVGMAAGYGVAYSVGLAVNSRILGRRIGGLDGPKVVRAYARLLVAGALAAVPAYGVARLCTGAAGESILGSALAVAAGGAVLVGVYFFAAQRMRVAELSSLVGLVKGRLGR
jgi:putative peptidoglycan lipid II flippase